VAYYVIESINRYVIWPGCIITGNVSVDSAAPLYLDTDEI